MNSYIQVQDRVAVAFSLIKNKTWSFLLVLFHFMAFLLNIKTYLHLVFLHHFPARQCFRDYLGVPVAAVKQTQPP